MQAQINTYKHVQRKVLWGIQTPGRLIPPHLDKASGYKHHASDYRRYTFKSTNI